MNTKVKIEKLFDVFQNLSPQKAEALVDEIFSNLSINMDMYSSDNTVYSLNSEKPTCCIHCGSLHFVKNGKDKLGHTRYLCRDCKRTFSNTSNSVVSKTQKDASIWKTYIKCFLMGYSLRKCAKECKICERTAFSWRHKIMYSLNKMSTAEKYCGLIEIDEMYVKISYKGNHSKSKSFKMPRKSYKRGTDNRNKGNSEKACVLCVAERKNAFSAKVVCRGNFRDNLLVDFFDNKLEKDSIIMTDCHRAYNLYFKNKPVEHIRLKKDKNTSQTEVRGAYHINNINAFHKRFRQFLLKYNGVSTKYLQNYLNLFIWLENTKNSKKDELIEKHLLDKGTYVSAKKFKLFPHAPSYSLAA